MTGLNIAVSHSDSDGVLCVALLLKVKEVERVYFTSPAKLTRTLCNVILSDGYDNFLHIFDMSGKRESIILSSVFEDTLWLDHHEWGEPEKQEKPKNVSFYVNPEAKSAASVVNEYFRLNSVLAEYADEIDVNNIKSEASERIYSIVESLRGDFKFKELLDFTRKISRDENEIFNDFHNERVEEHKKWLSEGTKIGLDSMEIKNIKNLKVGVIEKDFMVPISKIFDVSGCDILIGITRQNSCTKIEFRSKVYDVYQLASKLGGGGHKVASGTTLNGIFTKDYVLRKIEELI